MKTVAPIRRELGVKTFFNMLGPLVNPSQPKCQSIGVFNLELLRLYKYIHQQLDKNYEIIHSLDGYDEISLTSPFKKVNNKSEEIVSPSSTGFETYTQEQISGGNSIEDSAKIFMKVLMNEATKAQQDVVVANAALAINCLEPEQTYQDCVGLANASLTSGKALAAFKKLISLN